MLKTAICIEWCCNKTWFKANNVCLTTNSTSCHTQYTKATSLFCLVVGKKKRKDTEYFRKKRDKEIAIIWKLLSPPDRTGIYLTWQLQHLCSLQTRNSHSLFCGKKLKYLCMALIYYYCFPNQHSTKQFSSRSPSFHCTLFLQTCNTQRLL